MVFYNIINHELNNNNYIIISYLIRESYLSSMCLLYEYCLGCFCSSVIFYHLKICFKKSHKNDEDLCKYFYMEHFLNELMDRLIMAGNHLLRRMQKN